MRRIATDGASMASQDVCSRVPSAFTTTYKREYAGTYGSPAPGARVRTSRFYPSGQPDAGSTYRTHFQTNKPNLRIGVPYGTSSGNRKNNPHPHNMEQVFSHPNRDFFVWSHYSKLPPVNQRLMAPAGSSSSELLRKVCQDKIRSIYQQDYVPPLQDDPSSRKSHEELQPAWLDSDMKS